MEWVIGAAILAVIIGAIGNSINGDSGNSVANKEELKRRDNSSVGGYIMEQRRQQQQDYQQHIRKHRR